MIKRSLLGAALLIVTATLTIPACQQQRPTGNTTPPPPRPAQSESPAPATSGQAAVARLRGFDLQRFSVYADEIVVATVEGIESRETTNAYGDRLIESTASLKVERAVKGDLKAGDTVAVKFLGGTVGDVTLDVSDEVTFEEGERAVVFIARGPTRRSVLGGPRGKHPVDRRGLLTGTRQPLDTFIRDLSRAMQNRRFGR